ncbi:hypothetical protein GQ42DRAFT_157717 [Ramicandelaber brevisporus]|nr:hypothetical protein GQ42DRAFT_157717 [Ramicandelaber brevisporus]
MAFHSTELKITFGSYFTVFLLWFVCVVIVGRARKAQGLTDNHNPRQAQLSLEGYGARAKAAENNILDGLVFLTAGLFTAYAGGGNPKAIAALTLIYAVTRAAYIFFYVKDIATARSLTWATGMMAVLGLFITGFA